MPAALMNNMRGARRIGSVLIAPGTAAVIEDDSWKTNKVVKAWIDEKQLEVVPMDAVDKINAGMDKKKAIAAAKADEKEADAKQSTTPPPSK